MLTLSPKISLNTTDVESLAYVRYINEKKDSSRRSLWDSYMILKIQRWIRTKNERRKRQKALNRSEWRQRFPYAYRNFFPFHTHTRCASIHDDLNGRVNRSENGQTHRTRVHARISIGCDSIVIGSSWVGFSLWFTSCALYTGQKQNGKPYVIRSSNKKRRCSWVWQMMHVTPADCRQIYVPAEAFM